MKVLLNRQDCSNWFIELDQYCLHLYIYIYAKKKNHNFIHWQNYIVTCGYWADPLYKTGSSKRIFPLFIVSPIFLIWLFSVSPLFTIEKDSNFRVPELRCGVPLCPPNSHGTMASPENFFVTNFHSDSSREAVWWGPRVDSPEGLSKFSDVATETSISSLTIWGSMFSWVSPDVFSIWSFYVPSSCVGSSLKIR